ncbi:MAG: response regulator, partial [Gammaproteobacteria bacterium]|nr:response regulator [Gammaproteobacteria bacterium]
NVFMLGVDITQIKMDIAAFSMSDEYRLLKLVGEDGVVAANDLYRESSASIDGSGYDSAIADVVMRSTGASLMYEVPENNMLHAYFPVVLGLVEKKSGQVPVMGMLYAEYSFGKRLEVVKQESIEHTLMYCLITAVTSMLIGVLVYWRVSLRLAKINMAAKNLAGGDLSARAGLNGDDEISYLSQSFDHMAERLQDEVEVRSLVQKHLEKINDALEEAVEERTEILREAQRIAKVGHWEWEIGSSSLTLSDEVYRIFEISKDTQAGFAEFMQKVHPDDVQSVQEALSVALKNRTQYLVQHRIVLPSGMFRWVRQEAIPKIDADGNVVKMIGIVQDIHDSKTDIEKRVQLEMQLRQAQKMESLGQLTGGLAHDFNNLLASIRGFAELAMRLQVVDERGKLPGYLQHILKSSKQASELVAKMLTFSRREPKQPENTAIDVEKMLKGFQPMIRSMIPVTVEIDVVCEPGLSRMLGNQTQVEQVLINLCVNAKDAITDHQGRIVIAAHKYQGGRVVCSSCHHEYQGSFVELSVTDTGTGIEQDVLDSMFEPFFTTKDVGKGTGMGLAMVHGIVHSLGGHIHVTSVLGQGTKFSICLPVANYVVKQSDEPIDDAVLLAKAQNTGNHHVLVVDDDKVVGMVLSELLQEAGYRVTVINSSAEALDYFRKHSNEVDLVVTDYTMPGLHGSQLAMGMMAIRRDIPIILCTGYSERVDEEKAAELNFRAFIKKPIDLNVFFTAVAAALQDSEPPVDRPALKRAS